LDVARRSRLVTFFGRLLVAEVDRHVAARAEIRADATAFTPAKSAASRRA
jgi:hypothetical protein